jgi:hypothetical protein
MLACRRRDARRLLYGLVQIILMQQSRAIENMAEKT